MRVGQDGQGGQGVQMQPVGADSPPPYEEAVPAVRLQVVGAGSPPPCPVNPDDQPDGQRVFTVIFVAEQRAIFVEALQNTPLLQTPAEQSPLQLNANFASGIFDLLNGMVIGDGVVDRVKGLFTSMQTRITEGEKYPVARELVSAIKRVRKNVKWYLKVVHRRNIYNPIAGEVNRQNQAVSRLQRQRCCSRTMCVIGWGIGLGCWVPARLVDVASLCILPIFASDSTASLNRNWCDHEACPTPEFFKTPTLYLWCNPFDCASRNWNEARQARIALPAALQMERHNLGF